MKQKKNWVRIIMVLVLLIALNSSVRAYTFEKEQIDTWLEQLNSQDWSVRADAEIYLYYSSKKLKDEEIIKKIKTTLIDQLAKEIALKDAGQFRDDTPGAESGEYLANFAERVATFKDARSIPSLMRYNSIRSVRRALAEFGDPVAKILLKDLESKDSSTKGYAALTLGEMVRPKEKGYVAQGRMRKRIKKALIKTLKESKHPTDKTIEWYEEKVWERASIRRRVVRALGQLDDPTLIPLFEKIAREDPDVGKRRIEGYVKEVYPIREEAKKALERLKEKQ